MATSLSASMSLVVKATYEAKAAGADMSVPTHTIVKSVTDTLANGEGSGQAEVVFFDTITPGVGGLTIDIFGAITDPFNTTLSIDLIKGLLIHNRSTTTGQYVDVGGAAAGNTFAYLTGDTDSVRVHPEGVLFIWSPQATPDCAIAVADGFDEILFTAGAGTPTVDVMILGCT